MREKTLSVSEAARRVSRVVRRAEQNRRTVITRNGKAVARVVPARPSAGNGRSTGTEKIRKSPQARQTSARFPFVSCLKAPDDTDVRRVDDYLYGETH